MRYSRVQLKNAAVVCLALAAVSGCRPSAVATSGVASTVAKASPSNAESSDPASIEEAQLKFVKDYIDAIKSKDIHQLESVLHPGYRACVTPENEAFFDYVFSQVKPPDTNYKITSIKPVDPKTGFGASFLPPEGFAYPVKPTHIIQVDFEPTKDGTSFYSEVLEVASDRGSWYSVGPCPDAKGLAFFRQQIEAGARQRAEAKRRAAKLKGPLLSELKQLLQAHNRVGAIKMYSRKTGSNLTTSVQVIDVLDSSDR